MSTDARQEVLQNYSLIDKESPGYKTYVRAYPQLEKEPVYVLNKIGKSETIMINPIIGMAFVAVTCVEHIITDPSKAAAAGRCFIGTGLCYACKTINA